LSGLSAQPSPLPAHVQLIHKPARPAALIEALRAALDPAAATRVRRVLLVEDHPVNQLVARGLLDSLGVQTVVAEHGLEAIDRVTQSTDVPPFDLILMDCHMPELDGLTCTRRLRAREMQQGQLRTPIVAMSADSEAEAAADCLAAGMDGFIAKPVRLEQLRAVVERWAPRT
jgi:CheY-like chemotaxis protein